MVFKCKLFLLLFFTARNNEDCYKLDPNRNDAENLAEIVRNLTTVTTEITCPCPIANKTNPFTFSFQCQTHIPDQYLCLLNCTVKILKKAHDIAYHKPQIPGFVHGVSTKEFFYVITPILCHQMTQVGSPQTFSLQYFLFYVIKDTSVFLQSFHA